MKKDLLKQIANKQLFNQNETIIVALSGGVDSMVLFDILLNLKENLNLVIAHINHKQRKASDQEFINIKAIAKKLNIPFEGYVINTPFKDNFHDESRTLRYDFFKVISQKYNAKKIVLAHHLNDQVETVLMRIIRGSSFTGYSGISYIRHDGNISYIRPLISYPKEDILAYAKENNITYYEDASNRSSKYTRNRFRNEIIPYLKKENPNLDSKVIQLRDYIESADIVLEKIKQDFLKTNCIHNTISIKSFNNLEHILKIKVLKHIVNIATNNSVEVTYLQYNSIIDICLNNSVNKKITLNKDYSFYKEYEYIYVAKPPVFKEVNIKVLEPGEYFTDDNQSIIFSINKLEQNYSNYIELCYNKLVFPLTIRNRKNGDKIVLKAGSKKIKDLLIDLKIPLSKRNSILLIANEDEVLGIPSLNKVKYSELCNNKIYIYEVK
ncbi:MAG: tRNA lysidine(34) synthetase TilS [Candidatus Izemoplasma sp.]